MPEATSFGTSLMFCCACAAVAARTSMAKPIAYFVIVGGLLSSRVRPEQGPGECSGLSTIAPPTKSGAVVISPLTAGALPGPGPLAPERSGQAQRAASVRRAAARSARVAARYAVGTRRRHAGGP